MRAGQRSLKLLAFALVEALVAVPKIASQNYNARQSCVLQRAMPLDVRQVVNNPWLIPSGIMSVGPLEDLQLMPTSSGDTLGRTSCR